MTYIYTPFMKKVLHITERKRETNVHYYCKSDDFRAGFKVAKWWMFCHSAWLQISPARFKLNYSDKAIGTAIVAGVGSVVGAVAVEWLGLQLDEMVNREELSRDILDAIRQQKQDLINSL